jgi:hypothetical protein
MRDVLSVLQKAVTSLRGIRVFGGMMKGIGGEDGENGEGRKGEEGRKGMRGSEGGEEGRKGNRPIVITN